MNKSILIVEDETRIRFLLRDYFAREKNFTIYEAENGLEALNIFKEKKIDLIILDIMLPKLNGFDILKMCRQDKIKTPILFLTAKDEIADKVRGLDLGADDYLTKPFATEELLARIRVLLRRQGEITTDTLRFHDAELNLSTYELSCGVKSVKLGLKEFNILNYLFSNGNQIVTKELLIEKVWGFDADVEYNNVEVYISFLRKKLSFIKSNVIIRTVRGVGYCLGVNESC